MFVHELCPQSSTSSYRLCLIQQQYCRDHKCLNPLIYLVRLPSIQFSRPTVQLTCVAEQYRPDLEDYDSGGSGQNRGYAHPPREEMSTSQSQRGVQYAQLDNASFTPHAQWGYNAPIGNPGPVRYTAEPAYAQPRRKYQYAEMRGFNYSTRPQFNPEPSSSTHSSPQSNPDPLAYGSSPSAHLPYPTSSDAFTLPPPPSQAYAGDHSGMPPPPPQPYAGNNSGMPPPPLAPPPTGQAYHTREVAPPPSPGLQPQRGFTNEPRAELREPSRVSLETRMDRLSVSGNRPEVHTVVPGGGMPPPSPLLEAYKGTWQSMPSPIAMPLNDDDLDDLTPLSPRGSRTSVNIRERKESFRRVSPNRSSTTIKSKKKVSMYDAEADARDIAGELTRSHPNVQILVDILPTLSHDQIMELRSAYKRVAKVQGQGINIAKHIKLKTAGNFQKICYVTALGRWESEGYWANYWYQSNSARRELLIEALMGRSNAEIRKIKDAFKDKRYGDSLSRCMDKELKADKFRVAVLLALEERKQEENDTWPIEYRNKDVDTLYEALRRRDGGESAILQIVVLRSNNHLRDVLKTYERKYGGNFAKDALKKSNNLVVCLFSFVFVFDTKVLTCGRI